MNVRQMSWKNFRTLDEGSFCPCGGLNIIYGKNAQGKTNLAEGIWLFTGGKSFRGAKDQELTETGKESAVLKLDFFSEEREQKAEIKITGGKRYIKINSVEKKSYRSARGKFCAVVFSPEHISLVSGGPALRRNFIDSALCQIKPGYAKALSEYIKTLNQRNTLLKDIPAHAQLLDTLGIWDEKLSQCGTYIINERLRYLDALKITAEKIYSCISGEKEKLGLKYVKSAENLSDALSSSRRSDIMSGFTSCGPHRDDIEITVNSLSAKAYASQGQKRSAAIAMKLAEAEEAGSVLGENPVVILDDVMSELDSDRQGYILNSLEQFQVFITCCEPYIKKNSDTAKLFKVEGGTVSEKIYFKGQ